MIFFCAMRNDKRYFFPESDLLDVCVVPLSESLSLFSFSFFSSASNFVVASR